MAFVLLSRKKLSPENAPSREHAYDAELQLWIDKNAGLPFGFVYAGQLLLKARDVGGHP